MNREIKFRGRLVNSKEWTEGNLCIRVDGNYIITPDETVLGKYGKVDKETVGQYTGLHDKNEKEIYEGDIVKVSDEIIAEVIWENDYLGYFLYANEENSINSFENGEQPLYDYWGSIEVIGNIHENSELLGGE